MTNEELLDKYATNAMNAFIQKLASSNAGAINYGSIATESYNMAERMLDQREITLNRIKQEQERQYRYSNSNIKELNLPIRYQNCLTCEGIWMKEDLNEWTERELRRIPNLGMKGIKLIKEAMAEHGLNLKGQP